MTVTVGDRTGKIDIPSPGLAGEGVSADTATSTCTGARARSRAYPSRWGRGVVDTLVVTAGDYRQVWETPPTPIAGVRGWARAGMWTGHNVKVLRGVYATYTTVVAVPASALAYWATGALMHVSGLDDPEDPKETGWAPSTPPPVGELASRWWSDVTSTKGRRRQWGVGLAEGAAGAISALLLAAAWLSQRLGRAATVAVVVAACWWG